MVRVFACKLVLYCCLEILIGTFPSCDADVEILLEEYPIAYARPRLQRIGDRDIESTEQLENRRQHQHPAISLMTAQLAYLYKHLVHVDC